MSSDMSLYAYCRSQNPCLRAAGTAPLRMMREVRLPADLAGKRMPDVLARRE